jgi:anti-anti-sigma regulatory factor
VFASEADQSQNLLLIRYSGRVSPDEARRCLEEVPGTLANLPARFRLLVDLTDLESMDVSCASYLEKIMDLCNAQGVSTVVRVIPDPKRDIGLQIMSYFHYDADVEIAACESLSEALQILTKSDD